MSRDISVKAIAIGFVIALGGTLAADFLFTVVYEVMLLAQGVSKADLQQRILADESIYVVSVIIGRAFLAGGAFVAARIARGREVMHAGLVGAVEIVADLFFFFAADTRNWPSWFVPVSYGLALPIALLAGYVARRSATRVGERAA